MHGEETQIENNLLSAQFKFRTLRALDQWNYNFFQWLAQGNQSSLILWTWTQIDANLPRYRTPQTHHGQGTTQALEIGPLRTPCFNHWPYNEYFILIAGWLIRHDVENFVKGIEFIQRKRWSDQESFNGLVGEGLHLFITCNSLGKSKFMFVLYINIHVFISHWSNSLGQIWNKEE